MREDMDDVPGWLWALKKEKPEATPEGYFQDLTEQIMAQVKPANHGHADLVGGHVQRRDRRPMWWMLRAAALLILIAASYWVFVPNGSREKDRLSAAEVEHYLLTHLDNVSEELLYQDYGWMEEWTMPPLQEADEQIILDILQDVDDLLLIENI
ncbi:MAG: hypothetical protein KTR24_03330 [Saprospiraceae bacterium]|nr:hypothetical protein [Saprospiraceae bacterium]